MRLRQPDFIAEDATPAEFRGLRRSPTGNPRYAWRLLHDLIRAIEEVPESERRQLQDIYLTLEKFK